MCCAGTEYSEDEINGECPDCGYPTVNGYAFEKCDYSSIDCETCGRAMCEDAC